MAWWLLIKRRCSRIQSNAAPSGLSDWFGIYPGFPKGREGESLLRPEGLAFHSPSGLAGPASASVGKGE